MAPSRLPPGPRPASPFPSPRAFTLVEMLVVLGIIGLLMALILPALTGARRSAQLTKCANNLRQIGMAMNQYLTDNGQQLPGGRASATMDDPGTGAFDWDGTIDTQMTVADQLDAYFRHDPRVWRCPAARVVRDARAVRAPIVVEDGSRSLRPGYMYVSTYAWAPWEKLKPEVWRHFWMRDWMGRNVAGLKVNELNTLGLQPPSEIVLFLDYSSQFHSYKAVHDVYDVPQTFSPGAQVGASAVHREPFQSNFLYLDGHVAMKQYGWAGGLLNVLHRPIQQRWGGVDWTVKYAAGYTRQYPD